MPPLRQARLDASNPRFFVKSARSYLALRRAWKHEAPSLEIVWTVKRLVAVVEPKPNRLNCRFLSSRGNSLTDLQTGRGSGQTKFLRGLVIHVSSAAVGRVGETKFLKSRRHAATHC
jgi:hypothetical protein